MIVLVFYGMVLHLLSFVVLQVKYKVLKGKLYPLEEGLPTPTHSGEANITNAKISTGRAPRPSASTRETKKLAIVNEVVVNEVDV